MKTNDYSNITTMARLREERKALEAEVSAEEARIRSVLSIIRKMREFLMNR